ncbi:MAG: acetyl-CoA carboxylase biotin carboxyl carrier protein, partial [Clostridia bacterium]|nr:acetyl-CoA carboxylase biotin carboxyl carrier protein [Clostridia bacterium]
MNIREIRELAKLVRECELSALEVNEGDTRIRLERTAPAPEAQGAREIVVPVPAAMPVAAPAAPAAM